MAQKPLETVNASFDQLEEGEIRDDDFEDISDNSIEETPTCGKFVSTNESLRALSLSSVSDTTSEFPKKKHQRQHRKSARKRNSGTCKHGRKRRRTISTSSSSSSSSDEDPPLDNTLKVKLKEAVHIGSEGSEHKNSLQNRLKAMRGATPEEAAAHSATELMAAAEPLSQISNDDDNRIVQTTQEIINSDKIEDTDLEALRLEALKTAVLNKCQRRKRKKLEAMNGASKETPASIVDNKENSPEEKSESIPQEADEDPEVLRAKLLANFSKKSTVKPVATVAPAAKKPPTLPPIAKPTITSKSMLTTKFSSSLSKMKKVNNQVKRNQLVRATTTVAPLIISLKDDSDSDVGGQTQPAMKQGNNSLNKAVDLSKINQLLQETRAKVEAMQAKKKSEKLKSSLEKTRRAAVNRSSSVLEKSAVKLLPRSQQIEYQQLLKKLKSAEDKKRGKIVKKNTVISSSTKVKVLGTSEKISVETAIKTPVTSVKLDASVIADAKSGVVDAPAKNNYFVSASVVKVVETNHAHSESTAVAPPVETVSKLQGEAAVTAPSQLPPPPPMEEMVVVERKSSPEIAINSSIEQLPEILIEEETKRTGVLKEVATLRNLLRQIRTNQNGSLQMKSKYQVLTPVVKKIMSVNNERKRHESYIRDLMKKLNEVRRKLSESHEKFSSLVIELVDRKDTIDLDSTTTALPTPPIGKAKVTIDTPFVDDDEDISKKADCNIKPVTSTPMKFPDEQLNASFEEESAILNVQSNCCNEVEDMDVCNSEDTDMCQVDIVDPNDIDQIFQRRNQQQSHFPEYVSPLNSCERYNFVDPQGVLCPYELAGYCRDSDCTFKHYLRR